MRMGAAVVRAAAIGALVLCSAAAMAQSDDRCAVPGYLLFGDSLLQRVNAIAGRDKTLKIVVLGGTSSTLPGADGAKFAYPARLEATLVRRLPGLAVSVAAVSQPRQSALAVAKVLGEALREQKPSLVVWQTGTFDAMRGTDPESFRAAVANGVEQAQRGGADVVLVNMQYSPRTESVFAFGAYVDAIRWVAREREVPVFDRHAIMRYWYEAGHFNLYAKTKDLRLARNVHDCLGRELGALIIDAARLTAQNGSSPQ